MEPELSERRQAPVLGGLVVAVDAGQTATRAAFADGPVGRAPGVRHLQSPGGVERAAAAIRSAAERACVPGRGVDVVCVGLSGFAAAAAVLEPLATELARGLDAARVVLASDVVPAYLGALGRRPGVVVAAGTGSVVLAADGRGTVALVDGWGHLLGDAGSAFAIGRAGLASALRAVDGRGGSEALRARGEAAFGPLDALPAAVYGGEDPVRRVAGFAPAVAEAARAGDETARAIFSAAAAELATSVVAAAERGLGADAPADVSWSGGLFAAGDLIGRPLAERLAQRAPHLRVVAPASTPLDGARLLAEGDACALFPGLVWTWERP